jgi:C4-dicarboxylate-specific signal transduction histidine kinase
VLLASNRESNLMPERQSRNILHVALQTLLGCVAVGFLAFVSFQLDLNLATATCLLLCAIFLLSLWGSLPASLVVSIVAVGCLDYYFSPPVFSFELDSPFDAIALALFVLASGVITTLTSRVRARTVALALSTAKLNQQIAEHRQTQEFLQQTQELARVNRVMLMGEMTASIAHEVNQPLTGIVANAGTALRYLAAQIPDVEEARQYLEFIARDGKRAAEVIGRIRALVRRVPERRNRLDLNESILEVIALTQNELQQNPVDLQTNLESDLPLVPADRVQLQQVILNLIVNALEAMNEAGERPRTLVVNSGTCDANELFVEVRDTGPGLDAANLDRLFRSFYTTKSEGMGMGLSISRQIVESHGGRLWATANEPHGAVFRFTLPVEGVNADD